MGGWDFMYVSWVATTHSGAFPTLASKVTGSVDTTTATISTFLLNMVLHPEVQDKGRAEVYSVVGYDRLPTLAEYDLAVSRSICAY